MPSPSTTFIALGRKRTSGIYLEEPYLPAAAGCADDGRTGWSGFMAIGAGDPLQGCKVCHALRDQDADLFGADFVYRIVDSRAVPVDVLTEPDSRRHRRVPGVSAGVTHALGVYCARSDNRRSPVTQRRFLFQKDGIRVCGCNMNMATSKRSCHGLRGRS